MKQIPLTQGKYALIDDADFDEVSKYSWCFARYAIGRVKGKNQLMHVFLMGKKEGVEIDHINRNKLDNRRENLRYVNRSENMLNTDLRSTNKTGFTGVSFDKFRGKWRSTIKLNYKQHMLGRFDTPEEAHSARLTYQQAKAV